MNRMKHGLGYTQGVVVSGDGNNGGLTLLWKPSIKVEVRKFVRWYIDALWIVEIIGMFGGLRGSMVTLKQVKWRKHGLFWSHLVGLVMCHGSA